MDVLRSNNETHVTTIIKKLDTQMKNTMDGINVLYDQLYLKNDITHERETREKILSTLTKTNDLSLMNNNKISTLNNKITDLEKQHEQHNLTELEHKINNKLQNTDVNL
jgi:predicted transcriptional regulator